MAQSDSLSSCDSLPNALSPLMADDLASQQLIFQDTLPHYVPLSVADTLKRYAPGAYDLPYSVTGKAYDWHRLWINTSALSSAFVGTLLVLDRRCHFVEQSRTSRCAAIQAMAQPCAKERPRMGPRQVLLQLYSPPLCRGRVLHGCQKLRIQCLAINVLLLIDIKCGVGIWH